MATSGDIFCNICDGRHLTKIAEYWCSECEEGLCSNCLEHHNISRYTKHHEIILVDNYKKIPPSISKFSNYCGEHNQRYQNYCPKHESLCCPFCIATEHKDCTGLRVMEDVIKTSKTSVLLDRLGETLENIKYHTQRVREDRKQNIIDIEEQKKIFRQKMIEFRTKINSHLDNLEKKLSKEFDATSEKTKTAIESVLEDLGNKEEEIEKVTNDVVAIKHFASDVPTFLGTKNLEIEIEEEERYIKSLSQDDRLKQMQLMWNISEKVTDILSLDAIGSVTLQTKPPKVSIKTVREKQAQIFAGVVGSQTIQFENIKLKLTSKYTLPMGKGRMEISGCNIFPNGKMIFTDTYNSRIILLNTNGAVDKNYEYKNPHDVTVVDDTTVIISHSNGIIKFDTANNETQNIHTTTNRCTAVSYTSNYIVWCELNEGIQMKNLSDSSISVLSARDIGVGNFLWSYITLYNDLLFVTDPIECSVSCFRTNGEKVWQFKDKKLLRDPHGVDVDNDSNVYVASSGTNSIVLISIDGKHIRKILQKADEIDSPWAICFDRIRNQLLVTDNRTSTVCVYSFYL